MEEVGQGNKAGNYRRIEKDSSSGQMCIIGCHKCDFRL